MNRRDFLRAGGAAALAWSGIRSAAARPLGSPPGSGGLHVGFAPPNGGSLVPASRAAGGERLAGTIEAQVALCGVGAIAQPLSVEAAIGRGPRFQLACAAMQGELLCVSAPRRFSAAGAFDLYVDGAPVSFGPGGLPLRRGSYVLLPGSVDPRWNEWQLEEGRLSGRDGPVPEPHVVLRLDWMSLG